MNKKLTLLITLFCFSVSYAQKMYEGVKMDQGDLKLEVGRDVDVSALFKVPDGYVVYKKEPIKGPGGWHYFLEKYDNNLVSQSRQDISAQFEQDDYVVQDFVKLGDNYVLFTTKDFPAESTEKLFFQKIDWNTGKLGSPVLIYAEPYQGRKKNIVFSVASSSDKSMILLTTNPPFLKGDPEMFNFYVFDDQMEMLWERERFKMKELDVNYTYYAPLLGDNGSVYFLGRKKVEIPNSRDYNYEFEVVMVSDDETEIQPIKTKEFFFDGISLVQGEDGTIYTVGYYRKERGTGVDGVSLFVLDPESLEIVDERWNEFSKEFITAGWSDKAIEKADKREGNGKDLGISSLEFRDVIEHEDGTLTVVGEIFYITTSYNAQTGRTSTTYHYADLITSRLSEGEMINARFRKHHTYFGAYIFFNLNNELVVLVNDARSKAADVDMSSLTKAERKAFSGNGLLISQIAEDGKIKTSMLIDFTDPKYAGYRQFKRIRADAFLIREDDKVELMLETYLGSKKFAITRLTFD